MSPRLMILDVGLWVLTSILIVSIAFNVAHFSPFEFLVPSPNPIGWPVPLLLLLPPFLIIILRRTQSRIATGIGWTIAALLSGIIVTTFAVFDPSAYLGS